MALTEIFLACAQPAGVLSLMDIAAGMEHLHSLGVLHVGTSCTQPPTNHFQSHICRSRFDLLCDGLIRLSQ